MIIEGGVSVAQASRDLGINGNVLHRWKKELVHREKYQSYQQAKASLFYYIEVFYSRKRRHSALGYISPHDYEQSILI